MTQPLTARARLSLAFAFAAHRQRCYWLLGVLALLLISIVILLLSADVPSFDVVRASTRSSEASLLDRNGVVLQRLRLDASQRMLDWVPLSAMSPALPKAVVAAEDRRFYFHPGVDPVGLAAALIDNLHRDRPRGASTITMQLVSLIDPASLSNHGVMAKLRQIRAALAIELHWSKAEILEAYLNRLSFRGELVGIDAAARGLLAKGPGGLNDAEAAVLAALIRSPGAARVAVGKRACAVLRSLGHADQCQRAKLIATDLPRRPFALPGIDEAPHLARRLLHGPGEQLRVTLDADLQRFARETLRTHLAELVTRNVEDGAVIVIDNRSGDLLAYVGSSGDLSGAAEVDGVAALRQPGSTLKPFLYALALDQHWLNASSVLDDSPLALTTPSGLYIPQDYDRDFHGAVSVRSALGSSLNVPAVRTLTMVGVERFLQTLRELGLHDMEGDADHYGFGLALGAAETTLLELTNAYRVLANQGRWTPIHVIAGTEPSNPLRTSRLSSISSEEARQVLSPQASFIVADILADPSARVLTFGLFSPLSTRTWSAVKTGTSKGMRDNWAVGFTQRYTVGVWVGNFSGASMWDVSGITGAAPIWRDVVEHLHDGIHTLQQNQAPLPPDGVQSQRVSFQPGIEAPRNEWMIAPASSAVMPPVTVQINAGRAQLVAPANGAIIAPDPDIPQSLQLLLLQASSAHTTCLRLDGKALGPCGQNKRLLALPQPGRHQLELTNAQGKVLDRHTFDVRALRQMTQAAH